MRIISVSTCLLFFVIISNGVSGQSIPVQSNSIEFIENRGQVVDMDLHQRSDILFVGDGGGAQVYMQANKISYVYVQYPEMVDDKKGIPSQTSSNKAKTQELIKGYRYDMEFVGGNLSPRIERSEITKGYSNFYLPQCPTGITNVRGYNKLKYSEVYKNIDVQFSGEKHKGLKYDIVVKPRGKVESIQLKYSGKESIELHNNRLYIKTSLGEIEEYLPKVFQNINGRIVDVKCDYVLINGIIRFNIPRYNKLYDLVIDPWITYYGGNSGEVGYSVTTDKNGDVVFSGLTSSVNFPLLGAFQGVKGAFNDGIVVKFSSTGTRIFATYFGGDNNDFTTGVTTDSFNNIFVTGSTESSILPTLAPGSGAYYQPASGGGGRDAFIAEYTAAGTMVWATYYGGSSTEWGYDVVTDASDNVLITGGSESLDLIMLNAYQAAPASGQDVYIAKFNNAKVMQWSTFFGGDQFDYGAGIVCDAAGDVFICGVTGSTDFPVFTPHQALYGGGVDCFATKLLGTTGFPIWSTYYGGSGYDWATAIDVDGLGNVYVGGGTYSTNNMNSLVAYKTVMTDNMDAFLVKFNASGVRQWGTYLGGSTNVSFISSGDYIHGVACDANNNVSVGGDTYAYDFPVTTCAIQQTFEGTEEQFLTTFDENGALICSGYMGTGTPASQNNETYSNGGCIATDGCFVYLVAMSASSYPVTAGAYQTVSGGGGNFDCVLAKMYVNTCGEINSALNFNASSTSVCTNQSVNYIPTFTACGDTSNTQYLWTFPGGTPATSTSKSPTGIVYNTVGSYNVKLRILSDCVNDSLEKASYITVISCANPTASIIIPSGGYSDTVCPGTNAWFDVSGSVFTDSLVIDWGDGSPTEKFIVNPNLVLHVFSASSTVKAIAYSGTLSDTATQLLNVIQIPQPNFTNNYNPLACLTQTGINVSFFDATVGGAAPLSYSWDFGDGEIDTAKNPIHTYNSPGKYYVFLTVKPKQIPSTASCTWITYKDSITISTDNSLITGMAASPGCPCNVVSFTAAGSSATWLWDFGDNTSSTLQNPTHTFDLPGQYVVTLEGTGSSGCYFFKKIPITVCGGDTASVSKSNNRWYFGGAIGVGDASGINFNSAVPVALTNPGTFWSFEGCATMNDANTGNLLFYTNGENVWDNTHTLMPNGIGLFGGFSASQSSLIVPFPGNRNKYYIITSNGVSSINQGYYYSVVDMTQNAGKGDVVIKNNVFFIGPCAEAMVDQGGMLFNAKAVVHEALSGTVKYKGDCLKPAEYWVVIPSCKDTFKSFLITSLGISAPVTTVAPDNGYNGVGYSCISPDGTKFAISQCDNGTNKIRLFDFNKNTGLFSNEKNITYLNSLGYYECFYGLSFSPNSSILYATYGNQFYQFDLSAINISASVYTTTFPSPMMGSYLGPDKKIYIAMMGGMSLSVINNPDVIGAGSNVTLNSFSLGGKQCHAGLQNIIPLAPLDTIQLRASFQETIDQCTKQLSLANPSCDFMPDSVTTKWDFGDGTILTYDTLSFPNHTYLSGGTYTVKLVLSKNCYKSDSIEKIITIDQALSVAITATQPSCSVVVGSAVATTAGGAPNYSYTWSNGVTTITANNLSANTYTVTVTDANGCKSTNTVTIAAAAGPIINSFSSTPLLCSYSDGTATVNASGGSGVLTYTWNTGSSGATTYLLYAGINYIVTITDANGCSTKDSITLTAPPEMVLDPVITNNPTCGQVITTITVNVSSGGTPGYTYSWVGISGGASMFVSGPTINTGNANNGCYRIDITDNIGCMAGGAVMCLGKPSTPGPTLTPAVASAINCAGGTGSVTVSVVDGTADYIYSWSNGASSITSSLSNTITSLPGASYTITVTDSKGCSSSATINLAEPILLSIATPTITATACGSNSGSVSVNASGGTGNYTFTWSNAQTGITAVNLSATSYTVSVTDANGCSAQSIVSVGNLNGPSIITTSFSPPSCFGKNDGSANVVASGGTGPLTYSWSNGFTTITSNNLSASNYTITVIDGSGCSVNTSVNITQPAVISVTATQQSPATCGNSNGEAIAIVLSGTGLYTYSWSNGVGSITSSSNNLNTSLLSSTFTLTVTDANGCTSSSTVMIQNSNGPTVSIQSSTNTCVGKADGAITIQTTGTGLSYSWSNVSSTQNQINLPTGNYTVTVKDGGGCTATTTTTISQFPLPIANAGIDQTITSGTSIQLNATGGISFLWTPVNTLDNPGMNNPIAAPSHTTTYTVLVTDANSCTATDDVTIIVIEPTNCSISTIFIPIAFSPNNDGQNDVLYVRGIICVEKMILVIFDRLGEKVFETADITQGWDGTYRGKAMDTGVYVYKIKGRLTTGDSINKSGNVTLFR